MTCGRISASANSRTDLRSWICSGVYSKSTSDDFFGGSVPMHGAALAVAVHRHAAGDGNAEAHIKRTIRLVAFRAIHLLWDVADLLSLGNCPIGTEYIFGAAELVVSEARIPGEEDLF